jgi:hypothetical protein
VATSTVSIPEGYSLERPSAQPAASSQPSQPSALPAGYAIENQQSPQPPSFLSQAEHVGSDLLQGVGEGALSTVTGIGKLISDPITKHFVSPEAMQQSDANISKLTTPENAAQSIGKSAEDIAEFVSGDAALKSLSLGERLLKVSKVAQEYEKASPFVKAAIHHAMTAARVGAVTGAETTAKTGDVEQGLKAGAVGALTTPVAEGVGAIAGKVPSAAKALWNSATGKAIQNELQEGIRSVASNVATDVSAEIPEGASIRTTFENIADGVQQKAKGLYAEIDSATDGEFTNIQGKIRNVEQKLREIAGTDDAAEEKLFNQKVALNTKLDEAIEQATKNGVDPSIADEAKAVWRKQSALTDLDTAVKGSTYGDAVHAAEVVDPKKLVNRIQKLDDAGRLTEAIGDDHADDLLQKAYDSAKAASSRATKIAVAKGAAKVVGAGGALIEGSKLVGALSGSH